MKKLKKRDDEIMLSIVDEIGSLEMSLDVSDVQKELIPYHKLLVAMVARAIIDAGYSNSIGEAARSWLASPDIAPWSFRWAMDHLGLETEKLMLKLSKITSKTNLLKGILYDR